MMPSKDRRRPLLQFSLRLVLVGLTAVCVVLGVLAGRVARQRAAVAQITRGGGRVHYAHKLVVGPREYVRAETRVPQWLRDFVGDDWFYSVEGVTLYSDGCNDEVLKHVAALPHVKRLGLWAWIESPTDSPGGGSFTAPPFPPRAGVTDDGLRVLRDHPSLEHISFLRNQVTDAAIEHLIEIPRLRTVDVSDKDISATGRSSIKALLSARE